MELLNNKVLIKAELKEKTKSGFYIPTSANTHEHISPFAEVLGVVGALNYYGYEAEKIKGISYENRTEDEHKKLAECNKYSAKFDVDVEVKEGDEIIYQWLAFKDWSETKGFINYHDIIAVVKEDGLHPVNGYIIVEIIENADNINGIYLPKVEESNKAVVRFEGMPVRHYYEFPYMEDEKETLIGKTIWFRKGMEYPLEMRMHQELPKPYCAIQRKDILAYECENS